MASTGRLYRKMTPSPEKTLKEQAPQTEVAPSTALHRRRKRLATPDLPFLFMSLLSPGAPLGIGAPSYMSRVSPVLHVSWNPPMSVTYSVYPSERPASA